MAGLHVNAEVMHSQGVSTMNLSQELGTQIESLNANIDSLMTIWKGAAADQFRQATAPQIQNLRKFQELLDLLGQKIVDGAGRFDQVEQENVDRARNLFN